MGKNKTPISQENNAYVDYGTNPMGGDYISTSQQQQTQANQQDTSYTPLLADNNQLTIYKPSTKMRSLQNTTATILGYASVGSYIGPIPYLTSEAFANIGGMASSDPDSFYRLFKSLKGALIGSAGLGAGFIATGAISAFSIGATSNLIREWKSADILGLLIFLPSAMLNAVNNYMAWSALLCFLPPPFNFLVPLAIAGTFGTFFPAAGNYKASASLAKKISKPLSRRVKRAYHIVKNLASGDEELSHAEKLEEIRYLFDEKIRYLELHGNHAELKKSYSDQFKPLLQVLKAMNSPESTFNRLLLTLQTLSKSENQTLAINTLSALQQKNTAEANAIAPLLKAIMSQETGKSSRTTLSKYLQKQSSKKATITLETPFKNAIDAIKTKSVSEQESLLSTFTDTINNNMQDYDSFHQIVKCLGALNTAKFSALKTTILNTLEDDSALYQLLDVLDDNHKKGTTNILTQFSTAYDIETFNKKHTQLKKRYATTLISDPDGTYNTFLDQLSTLSKQTSQSLGNTLDTLLNAAKPEEESNAQNKDDKQITDDIANAFKTPKSTELKKALQDEDWEAAFSLLELDKKQAPRWKRLVSYAGYPLTIAFALIGTWNFLGTGTEVFKGVSWLFSKAGWSDTSPLALVIKYALHACAGIGFAENVALKSLASKNALVDALLRYSNQGDKLKRFLTGVAVFGPAIFDGSTNVAISMFNPDINGNINLAGYHLFNMSAPLERILDAISSTTSGSVLALTGLQDNVNEKILKNKHYVNLLTQLLDQLYDTLEDADEGIVNSVYSAFVERKTSQEIYQSDVVETKTEPRKTQSTKFDRNSNMFQQTPEEKQEEEEQTIYDKSKDKDNENKTTVPYTPNTVF
jgi:hypothetical protein